MLEKKLMWFSRRFPTASGVIDLSSNLSRPTELPKNEIRQISNRNIEEYIALRETEGIDKHWVYQIHLFLRQYLDYCNNEITKNKTLQYLNSIRSIYSQATYRKRMLQIRKFLRYEGLDWLDSVKIIAEPVYMPKRVANNDIEGCLRLFEGHEYELQIRALIMLGKNTGMRPTEMYRLKIEDINFENRSIEVKKTKSGVPRIVYFNDETKKTLLEYCRNKPKRLKYLFNQYHCMRLFTNANIKIKDLRKYFLQEWNRRNGNYLIGELLTGHSIRRNISLSHYVAFSQDEIKEEYDSVMN